MGCIVIFKRLAGIPNVALLVRAMVHTMNLEIILQLAIIRTVQFTSHQGLVAESAITPI